MDKIRRLYHVQNLWIKVLLNRLMGMNFEFEHVTEEG